MKNMITLLSLVFSLTAFSQENVELNSKEVRIDASEAIVVRTSETPNDVEIKFLVPMANAVCERYETRLVLRTSALHCGEDVHIRRVSMGRVCTRTNPRDGKCIGWQEKWQEQRVRRPRTCRVPESYCAQYGTATQLKTDVVKVKFKKLPALAGTESETFLINARQKQYDSGDIVYEIKPLDTLREYKVSQKKILGFKVDSYVVEEK